MRATAWTVLLLVPLLIGAGGIALARVVPDQLQPWFALGWFLVFGPGTFVAVWVTDRYWP